MHQHIHHSASVMEQFRRVLNPVQVARFFVWVEKNQESGPVERAGRPA